MGAKFLALGSLAFVVAASCSVDRHDLQAAGGHTAGANAQLGGSASGAHSAGAAMTAGKSGAASAGGTSSAGVGGQSDAGSSGTPDEQGGAGPLGGSAGEAGAGTTRECEPNATRSCLEGGAKGACAAGTQTCSSAGTWSTCSIVPANADTCEQSNDANCNGAVNEGCPCVKGATRSCADGGLVGKCATGTQTCTANGTWSACSIAPAAADTCDPGNNDNCSGPANEGCSCLQGTARACGACQDGVQTCTNGKTGQYSVCTGAVLTPTTWYRDADGDGYGSAVTTTVCSSTKPAGYTDRTGDCCDDASNIELAAKIHPGQMDWFQTAANLCGITWDYDCSGHHELWTKQVAKGCASNASAPDNCNSVYWDLTDTSCGTIVSHSICYAVVTPGSAECATTGNGGPQGCH